jgi:radical SAM protein with 4Fe4S-binding SPASM domain
LRNGFFWGQLLRVRSRRRVRCGVGRHPTFYVSSDGSVYPDIALFHSQFRLGSVSTGFEQLAAHPFLAMMRNRDPLASRSECAACSLRMFCGGGCPGENFQRSGRLEPDEDMCHELFQATEELLWVLSERPSYLEA